MSTAISLAAELCVGRVLYSVIEGYHDRIESVMIVTTKPYTKTLINGDVIPAMRCFFFNSKQTEEVLLPFIGITDTPYNSSRTFLTAKEAKDYANNNL